MATWFCTLCMREHWGRCPVFWQGPPSERRRAPSVTIAPPIPSAAPTMSIPATLEQPAPAPKEEPLEPSIPASLPPSPRWAEGSSAPRIEASESSSAPPALTAAWRFLAVHR